MATQSIKNRLCKAGLFEASLVKSAFLMFLVLSLSACGQFIANAKKEFAEDLSATILEFDDPETIKKAVPSYLILISSMIKGDPDNPDLLETGAQLYGAYASGFTDNATSKKALANRAFVYASHAICIRDERFCDIERLSYFEFEKRLAAVEKTQAESLFIFVSSWAGVIEANSSDWNAIAELPKVKAGIQRVLEIDETVSNGNAHLYMAIMESLLPPALGGKPEIAKKHFERAIELSNDNNLMAKVLYAEKYARMLFDRELHDELLQQVIAADTGSSDQVLINTLAKQKAAELLLDGDDYF
jgi:signal transduction histidine kinase